MAPKIHTSNPRSREQGYLLLGLLFLVAVLLITLAIAAPEMGKQLQREKDVEAIHRADQYKRAIQLYYRTTGQYPTSIDQLKNTNNVKYLRQVYVDPITGKKDWILLHVGQVPMITMGLFGQLSCGGAAVTPVGAGLTGSTPTGASSPTFGSTDTSSSTMGTQAGTGSDGSNPNGSATGGPNANSADNPCGGGNLASLKTDDGFFSAKDDTFASDNATPGANGASGPEKSAMPPLPVGGASGGDVGYEGPSGIMGNSPTPGGTNSTGAFGGSTGGQSEAFGGSSGSGGSFAGSTQGSSEGAGFGSSSGGTSGFGSDSGSTSGSPSALGGGPIVGVSIPRRAASIVTYRKQKIYNHWAIIYNPAEDTSMNPGGAAAPGAVPQGNGLSQGATGATGFNSGSGFGGGGVGSSNNGQSGFGSSSNGGGSPGMGGSMPGQQSPSSGYGSQSSPSGGGFGSP